MSFAQAALKTPGLTDLLIQNYMEGRSCLVKMLDEHGYEHRGKAGNFIFIKPKTDAKRVVAKMKSEKKILIKMYPNVGDLGDCLRVSIGERQFMQQFINALLEIDR